MNHTSQPVSALKPGDTIITRPGSHQSLTNAKTALEDAPQGTIARDREGDTWIRHRDRGIRTWGLADGPPYAIASSLWVATHYSPLTIVSVPDQENTEHEAS